MKQFFLNIKQLTSVIAISIALSACNSTQQYPQEDPPAIAKTARAEDNSDALIKDETATSTPAVIEDNNLAGTETPTSEQQVQNIAQDTESDKSEAIRIVTEEPAKTSILNNPATDLCNELGTKLGSVSINECLGHNLQHSAFTSGQRSLAYRDFPPKVGREPLGKILVIGGIHGDEFSSVSMLFRWMGILDQYHSGLFHWRFVPSSNPDGLLDRKSQRQNKNGVDLNRNFPTLDWEEHALSFWEKESKKNPRRFPGLSSASEIETRWLVQQIKEFNPDIIISMHAPYHLVDYDGPPSAPEMLGKLHLRKLGVFPGSLGNYAGIDLKKPIVTVELESAGIMPSKKEINGMWGDLIDWLKQQLTEKQQT